MPGRRARSCVSLFASPLNAVDMVWLCAAPDRDAKKYEGEVRRRSVRRHPALATQTSPR
ncbi:exported hypothetical protein [Cupriavidus oxalaticus]|uniref:Uncharacterized protein n=1 Tax=Cupriavidus oxalaticus TaxID=96344 RepID=A0A375GM37_9BURK|nr:exported hypothetical protein [Cupriavidus oxalaticus]SPC24339.1 exported hypothetical protein [Cupriavidus oxalaticus]